MKPVTTSCSEEINPLIQCADRRRFLLAASLCLAQEMQSLPPSLAISFSQNSPPLSEQITRRCISLRGASRRNRAYVLLMRDRMCRDRAERKRQDRQWRKKGEEKKKCVGDKECQRKEAGMNSRSNMLNRERLMMETRGKGITLLTCRPESTAPVPSLGHTSSSLLPPFVSVRLTTRAGGLRSQSHSHARPVQHTHTRRRPEPRVKLVGTHSRRHGTLVSPTVTPPPRLPLPSPAARGPDYSLLAGRFETPSPCHSVAPPLHERLLQPESRGTSGPLIRQSQK